MNIIKKSTLAMLFGAFAVATLVSLPAKAESNPFEAQGIVTIAEQDDKAGKCGEGKMKDGKCGEGKKAKKGKCGEGKCGEGKAAKKGKCGEGKCGEGKAAKKGKCGEGKDKAKKCGG